MPSDSKRLSGKMIAGMALGGVLIIAFSGWFLFRGDGADSAKNSSRETASKAATAWLEDNLAESDPQSPKDMAISAETTQSEDAAASRSVTSHGEHANEQVVPKSDSVKQIDSEQKTKRSAQSVADTKPVEQSVTKAKPKEKSKKTTRARNHSK